MHAGLSALIILCAQTAMACSPDSIFTFPSLIQPNLANIWAYASKNIVCIHARLCAEVTICAHTGLSGSDDFVNTLVSLTCSNLDDIWAQPHQKKVCMHTSMRAGLCAHADIMSMTSMSPQFCRYLYILGTTHFGLVIKILIFVTDQCTVAQKAQKVA